MKIAGMTVLAAHLYSDQTPINLFGRDILCSLKANVMCTPEGLWIDLPTEKALQ